MKKLFLFISFFILLAGCNQVETFVVDFDSSGGTQIEAIEVVLGDSITPPTPEKVGHVFLGWYYEDDRPFNVTDNILADETLYAKWEKISLTINFELNGGTGIDATELDYNTVLDLSSLPAKTGYSFDGWYLDSDLTNKYNDTKITNDLTFYAKWEIEQQQISFETLGGETLDPIFVDYQSDINLPTATKTDYVFDGWYLDSDLTIEFAYSTMPEYDLVIYAKYKELRPDLGGYTIKIAQAGYLVHEIDPFHHDYPFDDKEAKQQAWLWVEDRYNVIIEVDQYPGQSWEPYPWWYYIMTLAHYQISDYDFYVVPDNIIPILVEEDALIDVMDWYHLYGENSMDNSYLSSGSYKDGLYSITDAQPSISNVIYYNTNLLKSLGMEKTPSQLFNEDLWTYSAFKDYALEVQSKLNLLGDDYYALAGMPTYYWVGMANAGGVNLVNTSELEVDLLNPIAEDAATILQDIYQAGAMDEAFSINQNVISWNEGKALFNTGDLWFVNTSNRWAEGLWGEDTKYDYVPFPRPDSITTKAEQQIGIGGTTAFVMANYRSYDSNIEELNAENIYRAFIETLLKTEEFLTNHPNYNHEQSLRDMAIKHNSSVCSVEAFVYVSNLIKNNSFYEPIAVANNPITNTASGILSQAIREHVIDKQKNYSEVINPVILELIDKLNEIYS